ncbi:MULTISPECIES: LysE family translocator [Acinetobacter]|uniref:LysE family translocator n=1 Tax=Acinetobacter wuhouensis TaxID=1879050 RepID=A0A3G2SZR8_9GAMM|nr:MULTISPECIES: LysE family translocator [Acinetobacter]AYO53364.1 LysE family translocator [Acinetobacter wuhouensis]RZG46630.1 LysE family translocator [Acinetobacter wuhouensis]RZG72386.1 LysE family translocator [Acinetobacter wuhouensis]RZG77101.1 LysE family translocator [Acinetobacter sp. WCHAc060025]RZG80108.1 LysE family translocator [Acinetobacter sp. WCHAc060033]
MISWFFVGLVVTILLTPGPTNTLLASSGIQVGIRKSLGLIPAEALGYFISISLWGVIIGSVSKHFPSIPVILKLFSAGYILFLALKLWRTSDHVENFDQATIGIRELFIATLLNPKALLFASAIFPAFVWHNLSAYISHMLVFLMLIIPIAFFWTFIGSVLCSNKVTWLNQRNMQRTASLVLVSFTVPLSYSAILSL